MFPLQAHEFVDEQMYEQNCLESALQAYPSRSLSVSSRDGSAEGCCGCRAKRNTPLPNAGLPSTQQDPLQELSAMHIQCGDLAPHTARYNREARPSLTERNSQSPCVLSGLVYKTEGSSEGPRELKVTFNHFTHDQNQHPNAKSIFQDQRSA